MLRSYLRSAVRGLLHDKLSTLLNVAGLSIALASAIAVYLFLQVYGALDTSHEAVGRIQIIEHVVTRDGEAQTRGTAPLPLGPALVEDLSQVEQAVRMMWAGGTVRTPEASFEERLAFAEPGFFDVFTFPLRAGTSGILAEPGQVILSDATARSYFGTADPIGQPLAIFVGDGDTRTVTVGAVAAPFPNTASFQFSVLLPFDARPAPAPDDDWSAQADATFLLLRQPDDAPEVAAQMERYRSRANEAVPDAPVDRFVLETFADPGPAAYKVIQRATEAPHPAFSLVLIALAVSMMALACVNTVTIALGNASRRVREVGVRKVMGGTRGQLVAQFLAENLLLCAVALVVGIGIAWLFLIPLFNGLFVLQIGLTFDLTLWAFLVGLLAVVGVASGAYPALVGASFEPARIFRGAARPASKRRLTHALMLVQFVLAFLAVIGTVVLALNGRHLDRQAWGYAPDGLVAVRLSDPGQFEPLREAAAGRADVIEVVGTPDHVGTAVGRVTFALGEDAPGQPPTLQARQLEVSPGYAEAVGLRLQRGRFLDERASDVSGSALVNERMVRERGWAEPVGQTLRVDGQEITVVGVVGDFVYNPLIQPQPLIVRASSAAPRFLVVRVAEGQEAAVENALATTWAHLVPDQSFEAFAQTEVFDVQLDSFRNLARSVGTLAGLALLIGCMGVFGVATQNVDRQMKEAGVRKVLGASVAQLVFRFNRSILAVLTVAAGVATIVVAVGLGVLDRMEAFNLAPLSPVPFVLAYALVLVAVGVSVASQSRTLGLTSPADVLRRE